ncbi:MAG: ABC transporter ATP-binding protein [Simkaniaceae bacterium]|nr:ABC transporter ATP-binding protein [Simkaniaceae bacterium]
MKREILTIEDLNVYFKTLYGKVHAIRDMTLSVYEGEFLAIVGESGCGKSVTAKAILRLLDSRAVTIAAKKLKFQGQHLPDLSEKEMRKVRGGRIGMIFQDPMTSLNPTMRIGDQITEAIRLHQPELTGLEAKGRAMHLLNLVKIPEAESRYYNYPHELSGGMRQRVMIAIALAPSPEIIIADEPTTALDVTVQAQILELLKEIQQQTRTTIILITHDLSIVANTCDRVHVMYAGKIVESSSRKELFTAAAHPYTKSLLDSLPGLRASKEDRLTPIQGKPPSLLNEIKGCSFCRRCPSAMHICGTKPPPDFTPRESVKTACWLYDSRRGAENE